MNKIKFAKFPGALLAFFIVIAWFSFIALGAGGTTGNAADAANTTDASAAADAATAVDDSAAADTPSAADTTATADTPATTDTAAAADDPATAGDDPAAAADDPATVADDPAATPDSAAQFNVMFGDMPTDNDEVVTVVLNGKLLEFDVQPQLIESRTMVPMRKIFEELGATVDWEDATQTITAEKDGIVIIMQIDNTEMKVGDEIIELDVPPLLLDNRTLVPIRAVSESLNANVRWIEETWTVAITTGDEGGDAAGTGAGAGAAAKPARNPLNGALKGYGDDGVAEMVYTARYNFEQFTIPLVAYYYGNNVIQTIYDADVATMDEVIHTFWLYDVADVILNDYMLSGGEEPQTDEDVWAILDEKRPEYGLGDEHIAEVTIEKINEDTNAIIFKMMEPKWTLISSYVAYAYNETDGLKCFTLERSLDAEGNTAYMFCYVDVDSRGSYDLIDNNKDAFKKAIDDVYANHLLPSISIVRNIL